MKRMDGVAEEEAIGNGKEREWRRWDGREGGKEDGREEVREAEEGMGGTR